MLLLPISILSKLILLLLLSTAIILPPFNNISFTSSKVLSQVKSFCPLIYIPVGTVTTTP
jgi:hypothetical protein